jgi:hypothetical protein
MPQNDRGISEMRQVVIISPHFPPDTTAAAHRMRLLAPHLPRYGWRPTIVAVDPLDYEGRLDFGLSSVLDPTLEILRCRAWPARLTRRFGIGDLGFRALTGFFSVCARLLSTRQYDALLITLFPAYPALLGPLLRLRYRIPFVLDYQDPWVSSWGLTVGANRDGTADLKSRLSRAAALCLEPLVVRYASALTAVSTETFEQVRRRNPRLRDRPCVAIPLGGEPRDFQVLRERPRSNPWFDPSDGLFHLCYVGTLLPLGLDTLRAVFKAAALLRDTYPELYRKARIHFFGTSNQTDDRAANRVMPLARDAGVSECVTEIPTRVNYLDALTIQSQASALLLIGSSERHYTASKIYPAVLSRRPLLAVYHSESSVVQVLRTVQSKLPVSLITYDDREPPQTRVAQIYDAIRVLVAQPAHVNNFISDDDLLNEYSAHALAGRLAAVLDTVTADQLLSKSSAFRADPV